MYRRIMSSMRPRCMPPRTAACIPSALINGLPRIIRITGKPGDEPKVQIEIHARSGYYFNRDRQGQANSRLTGATYKLGEKGPIMMRHWLLTVLLTPASGTLEIPDTAEWMGYARTGTGLLARCPSALTS